MAKHPVADATSADLGMLASPERAAELAAAATGLPDWTVTERQRADLDLLVTGAYAPVTGFHTRTEARSVADEGRLPDGTPWPAPITLAVPTEVADAAETAGRLVLRDPEGTLLAILTVVDRWDGDSDGVGRLGGSLEPVRASARWDFADLRRPVAAIRAETTASGRPAVLAVLPTGTLDARTVDRMTRAAAALDAGLLVLAAAGADPDHLDVHRIRAHRRLLGLLPAGTLLALFPSVRDVATEGTAGLHAVVARNAGATHLLLGPGAPDAEEVRRLGLVPVDPDDHASPHDPPAGQLHPDVADVLDDANPSRSRRGVAVLLTGLSGSGKSTVAKVLRARLVESDRRRVTLLDGDLVRRHLSSELGFSREHRDLNVRRIGYVASEIAKHGGFAICCPIAPYDRTRREVREMVEATGAGFVLVHVATPIDVCEARDVKGLYARARAGELTGFTGVDDPYEPPEDAEVVIDTTERSPAEAAEAILDHLTAEGWLAPARGQGPT